MVRSIAFLAPVIWFGTQSSPAGQSDTRKSFILNTKPLIIRPADTLSCGPSGKRPSMALTRSFSGELVCRHHPEYP